MVESSNLSVTSKLELNSMNVIRLGKVIGTVIVSLAVVIAFLLQVIDNSALLWILIISLFGIHCVSEGD